ncbi:MAG: CDP-alcohol phosphatidyltransferase family protein [Paludibacter sp.]|nr:CDP-alcohol phosphatidyltransferase family protein [Paludibacter sp.]
MEETKSLSNAEIRKIISADRERTNILKESEQLTIAFLVKRMPAWLSPNMLTGIGFFGNILTFVSFVLAHYIHAGFLLVGVLGYAINWFGDSLDGRIAYYRQKSRKWFGFALDMTVDWLGILLMGLGFVVYVDGPWEMIGFAFVVMYGWEMITTLLRYKITGKYSIDSGAFGPTEVRIIISMILILEVLFHGSILYVSSLVTLILLVMNIIDFRKLLKLADESDISEKEQTAKK